MKRSRLAIGVIACLATLLVASIGTVAHDPVDWYVDYFQENAALKYRFGTNGGNEIPPAYIRDRVDEAAADASTSRYAGSPTFAYSSSGSGNVRYVTQEVNPCSSTSAGCARFGSGANQPASNDWQVYLTTNADLRSRWCGLGGSGSCLDARRVTLHEFGHISSLQHYPSSNPDYSVMYAIIPYSDQPGGDTHTFLTCDRAGLQLQYGRDTTSRTPSACLHEIANVTEEKLRTKLGIAASDTVACFGQSVTFSGTLRFESYASYEALANDPIGGRTVIMQYRAWGSTGSWTNDLTDTTNSSGDWSRSHAYYTPVDREWRAKFLDETMLYHDYSSSIRVRWPTQC